MSSFDLPPRSALRVSLESISWTILAMVGFLGNILVSAALLRNPILRKFTPVHITALAISDMLNFFTNGMFVAVTLFTGSWQFGKAGCFVCGFSVLFVTNVSVSTMSLTAINRYIRVTKPELFKKIFSRTKSIISLVCLWFFFALVSLLPFAVRGEFVFQANYAVCVPSFEHMVTIYAMATYGFFITISLLVVAICYCSATRAIKRIQPRQAPQNDDGDGDQIREGSENGETAMRIREERITKMMYAIVLAFVMLWIPILVLIMATRASHGTIPRDVSMLVSYASNISSLINPVLYASMNKSFRKEFKMILLSMMYCEYCSESS